MTRLISNPMGESPSSNTPRDPGEPKEKEERDPRGDIVALVMDKVQHARRDRDSKFGNRWDEYTRLWRGFFSEADKNRAGERSKLVSPALSQSIEMTVAEMEEAVFNRPAWFDLDPAEQAKLGEQGAPQRAMQELGFDAEAAQDPQQAEQIQEEIKRTIMRYRDQLLDAFAKDNVPDAISDVMLLGALYGTGIGKIKVETKVVRRFDEQGEIRSRRRVAVKLEAVRPDTFVIDPSAKTIEESLFVAHEVLRPRHAVLQKMGPNGPFNKVALDPYIGQRPDTEGTGRNTGSTPEDDAVLITEYHGRLPARLVPQRDEEDPEADADGRVECIVTIANETKLLRAVRTPFRMQDRSFVAYQHDSVPGEFWGRGVAEKGFNPAKALNAELRARVDALALINSPMMGVDITKWTKNADTSVRAGKTLFSRGRPSETYEPILLGDAGIIQASSAQAGDLERMVQMGTGAMDSAAPLQTNRRNETSSGMSMINSGFIKRARRTMQNLERNFLNPLIKKCIWRYVQFDPERWPADVTFVVNSTMGLMAKEVENQQLINMLSFTPPESPAHGVILKAIFDNTAASNKDELSEAIAQATRPPTEEERQQQQLLQQAQLERELAETEKEQMEVMKIQSEIQLNLARAAKEQAQAEGVDDQIEIQAANAATAAARVRSNERVAEIREVANTRRDQINAAREAQRARQRGGNTE